MLDQSKVAYCKIFPPVGIARMGDSVHPEGWFIGPDAQAAHEQPGFTFRDASGRVKRQAALFRLYAFDEAGACLGELTAPDADITWTVELANKKAAWFSFNGGESALLAFSGASDVLPTLALRNATVGAMAMEEGGPHGTRFVPNRSRQKLEIRTLPVNISGVRENWPAPGASESVTDKRYSFLGRFKKKREVYLGEVKTDDRGRLIVLGGRGVSDAIDDRGESIREQRWITNYANNDDWYDDSSDGPVSAKVTLRGSKTELPVRHGAWVVVAPPDFAPDTTNVVTVYDVMEEVAAEHSDLRTPDAPSPRLPQDLDFDKDITPIFERMQDQAWLNVMGLRGHGLGKPGDLRGEENGTLKGALRAASDQDGFALRQKIMSVIRAPVYRLTEPERRRENPAWKRAIGQANAYYMPPLSGDEGDRANGDPLSWLSLTYLQYERLQRWAERGATTDAQPSQDSKDVEQERAPDHPFELTRTAMERCTGGAFFPGIELSSIIRDRALYSEAFRFKSEALEPGDLTKYMACPWQSDFFACRVEWWPSQRPDDVLLDEDFEQLFKDFDEERVGDLAGQFELTLFNRKRWDRGVGKPRPSPDFLLSRLFPAPGKDETAEAYADQWGRAIASLFLSRVSYPAYAEAETAERLPSPWRLQFLAEEQLEKYSGHYLNFGVPDPDDILRDPLHPSLRSRWTRLVRARPPQEAKSMLDRYLEAVTASVAVQARDIFLNYPHYAGKSLSEAVAALGGLSGGDVEREHPEDFGADSAPAKKLRMAELITRALDILYVIHTDRAGYVDMIDRWQDMGFVVRRTVEVTDRSGESLEISAIVETERGKYSGLSFRDYFHILMNIEANPDFVPQARVIADEILRSAQVLIDRLGYDEDGGHPESYVPYTPAAFTAKLEEIYELQRASGQSSPPWEQTTLNTREANIRRVVDRAPFNQTDGAWLRNISQTGPSDKVRGLLFEVWSDEIGNGDPSLHHGNLYTDLLNSLGAELPSVNSREYANNSQIHEIEFIAPTFQLAISQHTDDYFPEILGMTLFLEWEVLSLVPGILRYDYFGINNQFWKMHVGIDNATSGHGNMAKRAVELYLDQVSHDSGPAAVQEQWQRIWRGFVAFAVAGYDWFGNGAQFDEDVERRYQLTPREKIEQVIERKAHYGALNHRDRKLGPHRLNDLFDQPGLFLEELANSPWIVPGKPDESRFISYLTSFEGPMYKIFDQADIAAWREWIIWLGQEGEFTGRNQFLDKAEAMLVVLEDLRELAQATPGHQLYRVRRSGDGGAEHLGPAVRLASLFGESDLVAVMAALRSPDNPWIVPGRVEESPIVVDLARAGRPMGAALDRRHPTAGGWTGREILIRWIRAGCPLPGVAAEPHLVASPQKAVRPRLLVEQFGPGAVH